MTLPTPKLLKSYYPLPKFPPISLSGAECRLNCRHCNRAYLKGMLPAESSEALIERCRALEAEGAIGVLLSGGSDRDGGILNLPMRLDAIRQVKAKTNLILNIHPGLVDDATAQRLTVDFASLEIPDTGKIRDVSGLDATTADYVATYRRLRAAGVNVVPHIAVYDGQEAGLLDDLIPQPGEAAPETIVVIVFSPTRGTPMADVPPPAPETVRHVVQEIGEMFPETELALGCMRPRSRDVRHAIELAALDAGVSRIALPSRQILATARDRGYTVTAFDGCCALPVAFEDRARRDSRPQ